MGGNQTAGPGWQFLSLWRDVISPIETTPMTATPTDAPSDQDEKGEESESSEFGRGE